MVHLACIQNQAASVSRWHAESPIDGGNGGSIYGPFTQRAHIAWMALSKHVHTTAIRLGASSNTGTISVTTAYAQLQ